MGCIEPGRANARSGGAGDAGRIVKPSRRHSRASRLDPQGRAIEAPGRRPPPLAMLQHRGAPPSWPKTSMT
ncbi:MAG: hypothetical protein ACE5LF_02310, partial [Alphaproteobacteria bacterium]